MTVFGDEVVRVPAGVASVQEDDRTWEGRSRREAMGAHGEPAVSDLQCLEPWGNAPAEAAPPQVALLHRPEQN